MTARILFTVNRPEFFLSHRLPLAVAASNSGYDVHVATPFNEHVDAIRATGLPWHEIHLQPGGMNVLNESRTIASLFRCYSRLRPHLVHQLTIKPVLYGTLAARMARVPAVVNAMPGLGYSFGEHAGPVGLLVRMVFRGMVRHPRMRFIFQNPDDRSLFVARSWARESEAIVIPGSGVDPAEFRPAISRPAGPPIVMLAGRLLISKGVETFVDAARILREREIEARFVLVGAVDRHRPDSVTSQYLEQCRSSGVVEVWGQKSDMAEVLRQATIVCLPSFMPEGVPKVLLEAAATELPIVTTDRPGCRDVVIDGETGLLIPPRDPAALADAIQTLINAPELRTVMGRRGRARVLEHFTLASVNERTLETYRGLLG